MARRLAHLPMCEEHKRYPDGSVRRYWLRLLEVSATRAITAYVSERPLRVADVWLPNGTVTLGLFWRDRPYNVYAWMNQALTAPLALYCNISDGCRLGARTIVWRDLWVDVVLRASGGAEVLDSDEVPSSASPAIRHYLEAGVDEVVRRHRLLEHEVAAAGNILRRVARTPAQHGRPSAAPGIDRVIASPYCRPWPVSGF